MFCISCGKQLPPAHSIPVCKECAIRILLDKQPLEDIPHTPFGNNKVEELAQFFNPAQSEAKPGNTPPLPEGERPSQPQEVEQRKSETVDKSLDTDDSFTALIIITVIIIITVTTIAIAVT